MTAYDTVVIGGGFFGCSLAIRLSQAGQRVRLIERDSHLLMRASMVNQARVHNGYHYPRSFLTAIRSRVNFERFISDYPECVERNFEKYYAVGRAFSKVNASQFRLFCERIGAPITTAPTAVRRMFNPDLIEDVFLVREYAFNADVLRERMTRELRRHGVEVLLHSFVERVERVGPERIGVRYTSTEPNGRQQSHSVEAHHVYNCTYAQLNQVLRGSALSPIPLKHEVTEMLLVEAPEALRRFSVTVMCGPFFSLMPFPAYGLHSLSHVRYTPHCHWQDQGQESYRNPYEYMRQIPLRSNKAHIFKDVQRFLPAITGFRYVDSIWEVKTVLPQSEIDDSRPILFRESQELPGLISILGGKIDNIYDVFAEMSQAQIVGVGDAL